MTSLIDQYEYNVSRSPAYKSTEDLPASAPDHAALRYIAYYLPQFHAIPENDKWWGKGFTEWNNVTKALPRYQGHFQPRLPGELGFYDLSNPDTLRRQAALARRAGIHGFCIHNYWFSGRTILDRPLEIFLENKDIDIGFCLNWANESWSRRWDGSESEVLLKQNHAPGEDVQYACYISRFVKDERYIRIDGRPLIMLYRPGIIADASTLVRNWRRYFQDMGLGDPYVILPQAFGDNDPRKYGMDAAAGFPPHHVAAGIPNQRNRSRYLDRRFVGTVASYERMAERAVEDKPTDFRLFPGVCPQWDNDARRPNWGKSFAGSTPKRYGDWLRDASRIALDAPTEDERIVFINAWNEWAEGAYLEPDRHYGAAYLCETRAVLDSLGHPAIKPMEPSVEKVTGLGLPSTSTLNFAMNIPMLALRKLGLWQR